MILILTKTEDTIAKPTQFFSGVITEKVILKNCGKQEATSEEPRASRISP